LNSQSIGFQKGKKKTDQLQGGNRKKCLKLKLKTWKKRDEILSGFLLKIKNTNSSDEKLIEKRQQCDEGGL
jgi:hypothetical protein